MSGNHRSRLISIVDRTTGGAGDLTSLGNALQTQMDRDYTPIWGGPSIRIVYAGPEAGAPARGVWPIHILDDLGGNEGGVHLDHRGRPYATVSFADSDWTVAVSHELLEMATDPLGHRFVTAPSLDPAAGRRPVHFLVEIGDPVEVYAYMINGVKVSDFVTAEFYDPNAAAGAELDFLGHLAQPYEIGIGNYISWLDPADGRWHQVDADGHLVTAAQTVALTTSPRDDRDKAFASTDPTRHHLAAARKASRASQDGVLVGS